MVFEDRLTIDTPEGVPARAYARRRRLTVHVGADRLRLPDDHPRCAPARAAIRRGDRPGLERGRRGVLGGGLLRRLLGLRRRLRGAQLRPYARQGDERAPGRARVRGAGDVRDERGAERHPHHRHPARHLPRGHGLDRRHSAEPAGRRPRGRDARHSRAPAGCRRRCSCRPRCRRQAWDTSAIGQDELDAVAAFLARRGELAAGARIQIAAELAGRLRPKVGGGDRQRGGRDVPRALARRRSAVVSNRRGK